MDDGLHLKSKMNRKQKEISESSRKGGLSKRNSFIYLNLILALVIAAIFFFRYYKKTIVCDCSYGTIPTRIIRMLHERFPSCKRPLKALMIFNELPMKQNIEIMGKLHKKYSRHADIAAFFMKRFKKDAPLGFPFRFIANTKVACSSGNRHFKGNFFVLLQEKRVRFIDAIPHPQVLAMLIEKHIPGKARNELLGRREMETKLLQGLNRGNARLWNLHSGKMEILDWTGKASTLRFYHSGCSPCDLKKIILQANVEQIRSERTELHVFSFKTSLSDLQAAIDGNGARAGIYLDQEDCFGVGFADTGHIPNPITIRSENLCRGANENDSPPDP